MNKDTNMLPDKQGAVEVGHCLRKEFTAAVIHSLIQQRQSINLIGEKGSGKLRLLEDIRDCKLSGIRVVLVDLKAYAAGYSGLLREIHAQLQAKGDVPGRLSQLFEGVEKESLHYLVLFANYDALLNNTAIDDSYDKNFFDDLNFIKNKDNVSLLCTTCVAHNTLLVFIGGESFGNSWVTLDFVDLPELSRRQMIEELERRVNEYDWLWLKSNLDEKEMILGNIRTLPLPYTLLCFFAGRINNQTEEEMRLSFKKRVKGWISAFEGLHKNSFNKRLHNVKSSVISFKTASGIKKFRIPIIGRILEWISSLGKKRGS